MQEKQLDILIVESNLATALRLQLLLEKLGHRISGRCNNALVAYHKISNCQPDLILMDVQLNDRCTGLDIGAKIKHLKIPILFMTPFGEDKDFETAKQLNMIGFLVKPIDKFSLLSAIYWLNFNYKNISINN